ncbi:hypothetical protein HELRODRAFT_164242 [Helobdella robusta]|uniref:SAP domain-containing protein n=1 Tax=Helobdella robusta TaxID=6412 RepID=T1EV56_HELRO|nr:hypothetical protein HELRODRAFT_164242 [Helobdella robusta]ESN94407.1 hypothetical protein HELRODRAFT_164242 [Helobdella robusta]
MSKLCGLNVVQLRELQKRSLVTSGNKEVQVARLREALIDEGKNPDEFKFDGADEDNEISTGTFSTAKMMELLLSMSTEMKQIKEQSERQTEELKQIKEHNCWNGKERATALILALRGSAAEVLQTIPAENHFNYEVLISALDLRYGEEHMKQIYRSQLRNRTQRSGESIQQLAQDIERLTLLSYPTSDTEHRDETALDTFIKALRDSELKQSLLLSDKRKLKDAVAHSLTFESAKQASKSDVRLRQVHEECSCQKVVVKRKPQQHGVPNAGFVVKKAIYVVIVNTA